MVEHTELRLVIDDCFRPTSVRPFTELLQGRVVFGLVLMAAASESSWLWNEGGGMVSRELVVSVRMSPERDQSDKQSPNGQGLSNLPAYTKPLLAWSHCWSAEGTVWPWRLVLVVRWFFWSFRCCCQQCHSWAIVLNPSLITLITNSPDQP